MNIETIIQTDPLTQVATEYVVITHDDGNHTSMLKSDYDAQQATLAANSAPQG